MKNVVIFGCSGLLGTAVVKLYKNLGNKFNVIGVSRDTLSQSDIEHLGLQDITWCKGSITDYNFVKRVITDYEANWVYNLAAQSIVRICETNPLDAFNVNILGNTNVLEACRNAKTIKGIIVTSSDKYYGQLKNLPYQEDMKPSPRGIYEVSKTCVDLIGQSYGQNCNLPLIIIRAANLFGPRDLNLSRLIPGSIVKILNNQNPIIYDDVRDYVREFIYVDDAAQIMYELIQVANTYCGEAVNIGSGYYTEIHNLVNSLIRLCKSDVEIDYPVKDNPFFEIDKQYLDLTKLYKMIGERPKFTNVDLDKCLMETIKWYKGYLYEK